MPGGVGGGAARLLPIPICKGQCQLADLGVQHLHIDGRRGRYASGRRSEYTDSPLEQPRAPLRDLAEVHVKLLSQFRQRLQKKASSLRHQSDRFAGSEAGRHTTFCQCPLSAPHAYNRLSSIDKRERRSASAAPLDEPPGRQGRMWSGARIEGGEPT